jgi:hypothetical protein
LTIKKAIKTQLKVIKRNEKKSLIMVLPYKKAFIGSIKAIMFAEYIKVVIKGEGFKIVIIRTQIIYLP